MATKAKKESFWVNLGEITVVYVLTLVAVAGLGVTLFMVPVMADMVGSQFGYTIIN